MKFVVQLYAGPIFAGWLHSIAKDETTFTKTNTIMHARKFGTEAEAQNACEIVAACTNGQVIGSYDMLL